METLQSLTQFLQENLTLCLVLYFCLFILNLLIITGKGISLPLWIPLSLILPGLSTLIILFIPSKYKDTSHLPEYEGWHKHQEDVTFMRWWDGKQWTRLTRNANGVISNKPLPISEQNTYPFLRLFLYLLTTATAIYILFVSYPQWEPQISQTRSTIENLLGQ